MRNKRTKFISNFISIPVLLFGVMTTARAETVMVETLDCTGSMGFSSFDERRLHRIEQSDCANPLNDAEKLQKVILRSRGGVSAYEVLWVSQDEARRIMDQVRGNRDIRQNYLKNRNQLNVNIQESQSSTAPVPAITPAPTGETLKSKPAAETMQLEVLDPPLSRSASHLVSGGSGSSRIVVGRVQAPGGLLSLTVNGTAVDVNEKGVFRGVVAVEDDRTEVRIVAIDEAGQRQEREFTIVSLQDESVSTESASIEDFGAFHALLIGATEYSHLPALNTSIRDIDAIGGLLMKQYGFELHRLVNPTRYEILSALNDLRKKLTETDNLLIYYAGHGEYDRKNSRGHWLPVDAELDNTANWISTVDLTDHINRMSARHIMVIADSCYSGALTRAVRSELDPGLSQSARQQWLKLVARTPSRTVLTSGGLKPVLDGGGGDNSVFANALLDVLRENDAAIDGAQIHRLVKDRVAEKAREFNLEQVPEYGELKSAGHEFGDFVIVTMQGS